MRTYNQKSEIGNQKLRHGFTLVELLTVITIIGILISLLACRRCRRRGKRRDRCQCGNNLRQVALAAISHAEAMGQLPQGSINQAPPFGTPRESWFPFLLPYLEQQNVLSNYDFTLYRNSDGTYTGRRPLRQRQLGHARRTDERRDLDVSLSLRRRRHAGLFSLGLLQLRQLHAVFRRLRSRRGQSGRARAQSAGGVRLQLRGPVQRFPRRHEQHDDLRRVPAIDRRASGRIHASISAACSGSRTNRAAACC